MKGRKYLAALACAAMLAAPSAAFAESTDLKLLANDNQIWGADVDQLAYITDAGRTMIPLRNVCSALGYDTDWQSDGSIHLTNDEGTVDVTLQVGSTDYMNAGTAGHFEVAPVIKDNRTYLLARDFTKLDGEVYWDGESRTVWIAQGDDTRYQIVRGQILRLKDARVKELVLPEGYSVDTKGAGYPLVNMDTIDGVTYLGILTQNNNYRDKIPLFRDAGDSLSYVADIYGCARFTIDGDTLYANDGAVLAGGWDYEVNPNRLSITDLTTGETTEKILDFVVNDCTLSMQDGKLIATSPDGTEHEVALD
ncbi:MAG: copper amine oxidase N-terminal domain-containing protein [Peptococcaceae bacterium]|nr:copper amine oxidase N-terminal domain-containing protein [Peptococcaceae bacterium]